MYVKDNYTFIEKTDEFLKEMIYEQRNLEEIINLILIRWSIVHQDLAIDARREVEQLKERMKL